MRTVKLIALAVACAFAILQLGIASASADFGFSEFTNTYENDAGQPFDVAGAHANTTTIIKFNGHEPEGGGFVLDENVKDVEFDLPAGFYGNQTVAPTCNPQELVEREGTCAIAAQVGTFFLEYEPGSPRFITEVPVYRLPTTKSQTALLGAVVLGVMIRIEISPRTDGDYGLTAKVVRANQGINVVSTELVLWGVPASAENDDKRFTGFATSGAPAGFAPAPFLSLPDRCEPVTTTVRADSWQNPGHWVESSVTSPPLTGCDDLVFEPTLRLRPQSSSAGEPTGVDVELHIPQEESVVGQATPQLRRAVVTLPQGVSLSAGSASGLGSCPDSALAIGTNVEPTCPNSSKLGTVEVDTPVLEEPLTGFIYLGTPQPGKLFRLFLVLHGPGMLIKIPGLAEPDPATGQITTTFNDTPQLPFETMHLEFKSGPRAPISTPTACGTYTTHAELTSWTSPEPVSSDSSFTIDQNCGNDGKFTPSFEAGTSNPTGGSYSPFTLRVTEPNGQQNLRSIEARLPKGLLAKLAGIPMCEGSAAASGSCSAASQVGTTTVGAGPGSNPIYVPEAGREPTAVYLGGPYKGAPLSLIVKVPAQAGPFDLGTVVVRNALFIDPETTQATAKSDALPQILEGVPVSYRDVRVEIDRPGFTVNPTNCEPQSITSTLVSSSGTTASPSDRFQAASCASLGLAPKLALKFSGAPTRRGGHPKLTATLTTKSGDANLKQVQVILPKTEYLENAHIRTVCTRVQYAANKCPAKSIYGHAKAWTPLLDKPLEGPVYLRSSSHKLPDLVASLDGQIHVDLDGRISSVDSRIRNTFEMVPDAPVTKFVLTMQGGGKGLLVNNTNICRARPRATVEFDGQNGKAHESNPLVKVGGCGKKDKKK